MMHNHDNYLPGLRRVAMGAQRHRAILLLLALVMPLLVAVGRADADSIRLRRSVVLPTDTASIQLKMVAELTGPDAVTAGEIVMRSAAELQVNGSLVVTIKDIRKALKTHGTILGRIAFSGNVCQVYAGEATNAPTPISETVQARSAAPNEPGMWAAEVMAEGTLRGQVARLIATAVHRRDPATVRLEFAQSDFEKLNLSTMAHDFEIIPQATASSPRLPLEVRVFQGDRFIRTFRVTVKVRLQQDVYIAERYLSRGEAIRPGDFSVQPRLLGPSTLQALSPQESLTGKETRGRITKGSVLRVGDALSPVSVRRHDEVKLLIKRGAFTISMPGRALESGRFGDVIRVRSLAKKTEMKARIETAGILIVISR